MAVKGLNLSVEGSHEMVPYISSICNCLGIVQVRGSQRHMKLAFGVRVCTRVKQWAQSDIKKHTQKRTRHRYDYEFSVKKMISYLFTSRGNNPCYYRRSAVAQRYYTSVRNTSVILILRTSAAVESVLVTHGGYTLTHTNWMTECL